ncbi:DUF1826 domain-containing protein [Kaistella palustris]|uniref:hypothetical protein n=1 Tax=Kaistella palustris TaxID=493376 RepID=UPI0003FB349D|nr:hypothetical protein [Kaistella palustris]
MFQNNPCKQQIKTVASFDALMECEFRGTLNAVCWERNLTGDFLEIVSKLELEEDITEISTEDLLSLKLSEKGNMARSCILNDLDLLTKAGALPSLNLLKCYERDDVFDFISTDVYSFHVDRSPVATSTFLCTYFGAASEILPNADALKKVSIPKVREQLAKIYDGDEADFEKFLVDNYFDLHYEAKSGSRPINLGVGNLWKLAVDHPGQKSLPCVHRAPIEKTGELRLLLIC